MFIPNNTGLLTRQTGLNAYSEPTFSDPELVECGVVRIRAGALPTSVRADSSASRGTAEEVVATAKILFLPLAYPNISDKFEIDGIVLRCTSREPRYSVLGELDHHECDFESWPG